MTSGHQNSKFTIKMEQLYISHVKFAKIFAVFFLSHECNCTQRMKRKTIHAKNQLRVEEKVALVAMEHNIPFYVHIFAHSYALALCTCTVSTKQIQKVYRRSVAMCKASMCFATEKDSIIDFFLLAWLSPASCVPHS